MDTTLFSPVSGTATHRRLGRSARIVLQVLLLAFASLLLFGLTSKGVQAEANSPDAPNPALSVSIHPSRSNASVGDVITYTYLVTNTGNVTLQVEAFDDKIGTVSLLPIPAGTTTFPTATVLPGQQAIGSKRYTVQHCDPTGPFVNTVMITGTGQSTLDPITGTLTLTPTVNVTTTASATATVALSTTPRPTLTAQSNTIYLGCTIHVTINAAIPRAETTFQVVVVAGPAPVNLILDGVQESYPFVDLQSIAGLTNQFLNEVCPSNSVCKVIKRAMFGFGPTYQNETIQNPEVIQKRYLPFGYREATLAE